MPNCILYRNISSATDAIILQEDLNKLAQWAKTWGMYFNNDKCMVLQVTLEQISLNTEYFLDNQKLNSTTKATKEFESVQSKSQA